MKNQAALNLLLHELVSHHPDSVTILADVFFSAELMKIVREINELSEEHQEILIEALTNRYTASILALDISEEEAKLAVESLDDEPLV